MPKLEIPFSAANGGLDYAILTGKRAAFPFADGKRTSDTPNATTISVALQGNAFASLNVKIEGGNDPLPGIEDTEIKAACAAMKPAFVRFLGGSVSLYSLDGTMRMSGTASAVEIVSPSGKT